MDTLWPAPGAASLTDAELEARYAYPEQLSRPWVRVNFVSSVDGAVSVGGVSKGLSSAADHKVFMLGRDLADVVLVGLGTALAEGYRGVRAGEVRAERRQRLGLAKVPPIALVTSTCSLHPDSPLVTDTLVPLIVLTCASAPQQRRRELADAGADVVIAGDEGVDLAAALDALAGRGLLRVDCEGGPTLFGNLIAADLVDELCLTLSPLLAAGDSGRIAHGPLPAAPRELDLVSVLHAEHALLLRYRRNRP